MEPFIVSARKYRPQTFKDVVGQQAITNTLLNAIENDHLAQALLFCGPRGVGKTSCARILAKKINQDGNLNENEDYAFNIFELDAASNNSVDDIRNLNDQVRIPPQSGKYKVYIIDEVHMLSSNAFNAFLKTLEEPPKHAIFILATTEKHKIIPTILSRCQIFDFKRITVKDAANYLKYISENQGIEAEDDALHIIAQKADGAMRDALSIFDRVVSFCGKHLTRKAVTENLNVLDYETYFEATDYILSHNIPELLLLFNRTLALGFEGHNFIGGLATHFRDLMVCQHQNTINLLEVSDTAKQTYLEQSKKTTSSFLIQALTIANDCDLKYKTSKNQRLLVELSLMKLASIGFDGEKKNSESEAITGEKIDFIAPASYFSAYTSSKKSTEETQTSLKDGVKLAPEKAISPSNTVKKHKELLHQNEQKSGSAESNPTIAKKNIDVANDEITATPKTIIPPKLDVDKTKSEINTINKEPLAIAPKRVSALSISSLKAKKVHQQNRKDQVIDESQLPKESFSEESLRKLWAEFVNKTELKGQKILASNLNIDLPKLKNETTICIELPNESMKKEVEREQYDLMEFLKSKLKNYFINLEITVNETAIKKFAFTPEEKYNKLRDKNPVIDLLRKEFDLDF